MEKPEEIKSSISSLCISFVMLLRQFVQMFLLETKLASVSFLNILGVVFVGLVLIITTWLCILASASLWLIQAGVSWPMALLAIAGLNLGLLFPCYWSVLKLKDNLSFTATRRQLRETSPPIATSENV